MAESNKWVRASSTADNAGGVEVLHDPETDEFYFRNGANPVRPGLTFTREEWEAFEAGVKAGEFDF